MNLPSFITFTGVDEWTDIGRMLELQFQYPVEWGILFSPKRQGSGRYPPISTVAKLHASTRMKLSAHLCGGYSEEIITRYRAAELPHWLRTFLWDSCDRAQINTTSTDIDLDMLYDWGYARQVQTILQCRDQFPGPGRRRQVWLFDASGGRGVEPADWPKPPYALPGSGVRGYAGGLNASNVAAHVKTIGEYDRGYWIDMETGVRDEHDHFDLDRCEQVCKAVYGDSL